MGVLVVCVGRGWGEGVEGCSPVWEPGGARAACLRQAEIKPQFCFVLFLHYAAASLARGECDGS